MMKGIRLSSVRLPKANFMLRKDSANTDGECPINIYYLLDRKIAKASIGVSVKESEWDSTHSMVKKSHPRHEQLNTLIQLKRHEYDALILDAISKINGNLTIDMLRNILRGESVDDVSDLNKAFVDFANEVMEKEYKLEKIGISVLNNAKCGLNIFSRFCRVKLKRNVLVKDLTVKLIEDYIIWRKDERENTNETINKALTPIFKAVKTANSMGLIETKIMYEICKLYLAPSKADINDCCDGEEIRYLSYPQLQQFIGLYDIVKYDRTRDYMDLFMFSFHACGMRFVDLLTLQWSNIDYENNQIKKVLVKTKVMHTIPLTVGAKNILQRWKDRAGCSRFCFGLLPSKFDLSDIEELNRLRLNKNRAVLTSLQEIGRKLNLPFTLSIHCARHTFAVLNLNRETNPLSVHTISRLLGHTSILVTEKVYARFIPQKLEDDLGLDAYCTLTPSKK